MPERTVELTGHIIDSGMMQRAFGVVMDMGGQFHVETFDVGSQKDKHSYCRMRVEADDEDTLQSILHELHQNGASVADPVDARTEPAPADHVVPQSFYSTTNHRTEVRYDGEWIEVEGTEMDCAVVVDPEGSGAAGDDGDGTTDEGPRAYTEPLSGVEAGDLVVVGEAGVRVHPPERPRDAEGPFGFMQGGVSSERPSESLVREIAEVVVETRADGGDVLVVPGPAVIHAGGREALAELVREGYVTAVSAGNGFAVHDLERDLYGTSLGMDVETLDHPRTGHKHHIRTIGEVIRAGSIPEAIEQGVVGSGVIYECVDNDVPWVLAGSIRDDGPLPDTITDTVAAQDAIREQAQDADLVLMLATLLHSVAVGNCLPSETPTICVDIDPATVTQLVDRGSAQATGMVTDVGMFLPRLAEAVTGEAEEPTG
ncbi:TIGR00300 family protein [Halobaculum sp. MBLA0143]|uniref:ornithine cyclodeaminase n=1 Tax=Halobaculum sp. MBLA0143 TaxID=3079933 RepID=UPI0035262AF7